MTVSRDEMEAMLRKFAQGIFRQATAASTGDLVGACGYQSVIDASCEELALALARQPRVVTAADMDASLRHAQQLVRRAAADVAALVSKEGV